MNSINPAKDLIFNITGYANTDEAPPTLPTDVLDVILSKISGVADRAAACVCKRWNQLVPQLPNPNHCMINEVEFWKNKLPDPSLRMFDEKAWDACFRLQIQGEIPKLPPYAYQLSRALRGHMSMPALREYGSARPLSLILMPKDLSLNKLKELARVCGLPEFDHDWDPILEQHGDYKVPESYWILFTSGAVKIQERNVFNTQLNFINQRFGNAYDIPDLLEAAVRFYANNYSNQESRKINPKEPDIQFIDSTFCKEIYGHYWGNGSLKKADNLIVTVGNKIRFAYDGVGGTEGTTAVRRFYASPN